MFGVAELGGGFSQTSTQPLQLVHCCRQFFAAIGQQDGERVELPQSSRGRVLGHRRHRLFPSHGLVLHPLPPTLPQPRGVGVYAPAWCPSASCRWRCSGRTAVAHPGAGRCAAAACGIPADAAVYAHSCMPEMLPASGVAIGVEKLPQEMLHGRSQPLRCPILASVLSTTSPLSHFLQAIPRVESLLGLVVRQDPQSTYADVWLGIAHLRISALLALW